MNEIRPIDANELMKVVLGRCRTEFEIKNKCLSDETVIAIIQNAPTLYPVVRYEIHEQDC